MLWSWQSTAPAIPATTILNRRPPNPDAPSDARRHVDETGLGRPGAVPGPGDGDAVPEPRSPGTSREPLTQEVLART